jgi:arylsulfatase A-like enzyme
VRWPERIKPGERKQFGGVEDLLPTLLDLTAVKADVTPHQPFTGVSLRASLDDASVEAQHPELLRMAIAGPGSPKPHIADVTQRKFEDYHLTLRGPRFKYHALPGGQAALYDIAADPGETTDAQTKFPEVTASMATKCRERWQVIIASGRAFTPENSLTK